MTLTSKGPKDLWEGPQCPLGLEASLGWRFSVGRGQPEKLNCTLVELQWSGMTKVIAVFEPATATY